MTNRNRVVLKAPTIIDVAQLSGVSKSTVSRILNGHQGVNKDVVKRVRGAMMELGYTTNQAARSLRTRKSQMVGVIIPTLNEIYSQKAEGVDQSLRAENVSTVVSFFGWSVEKFIDSMEGLISRGVDGLVTSLPSDRDERVQECIRNSKVPVVLLDREVDGANNDAVLTDSWVGIHDAIAHLAQVGRSRIGLITMSASTRPGRVFNEDYLKALDEYGLSQQSEGLLVRTNDFSIDSGRRAITDLLARGIDAVIAATPMAPLSGVMGGITDAGLSFPRDVSLVGLHENELSLAKFPKLSVIDRSLKSLGVAAGEMILARIADPARQLDIRTFPTFFSRGQSSDPQDAPLMAAERR
jgi:LacI family transcriptional regulator